MQFVQSNRRSASSPAFATRCIKARTRTRALPSHHQGSKVLQQAVQIVLCWLLSAPILQADKPVVYEPWPMHHVCRDFLIANSLNAADVDGDGFNDYSVIDERRGLMTIIFHPGKNGDVRKEWPRLVLGETGNPEYACLGDLDGDGAPDFITVEGDDLSRGLPTGVRVFWSPGKGRAREAAAWQDAGHIPGTENGQYLYAECHDVDGDGALDIVVGGRRHMATKKYAGIRWLRAPKDTKDRRDLAKWTTHFIDPDALSGHGFVFADINGDGQPDLVVANADWDTPRHEQEMFWYENPGAGKPAQQQPWPRHSIWKSAEFYAKPQTAIGDYDSDGLLDIATQTQNFIHFFRCKSRSPVAWQHLRAMKPDWVQWLGRPVKFADLNGDGRLDLVGALIHNDGNLPKDKASVFWLENNGRSPDTWKFFPIKWSDGANTRDPWIGEKWDHLIPLDVDGDGDLDLLGNVEEHYHRGPDGKDVSWFSVVWFENPLK